MMDEAEEAKGLTPHKYGPRLVTRSFLLSFHQKMFVACLLPTGLRS